MEAIKKNILVATLLLTAILFIGSSCNSDDCEEKIWYQDSDADGYGNINNSQKSCSQPTGYVADNTDFDDLNSTAYPNAIEICDDGIDNDGNGAIDDCIISKISGNWTSIYGDSYAITNTSITIENDIYHVLFEGENFVICQNGTNNNYNPDLFSKFIITNLSSNELYYCQSFYDMPSQISIENASDPSDVSDLTNGCGGNSWIKLIRN